MLSRFMVLVSCLLFVSAGLASPQRDAKTFGERVYKLHQYIMAQHEVRTTSKNGGYGGIKGDPDFYKQVNYYDKKSGLLLSMIQWEIKNPENVHTIEVYIRDASGKVIRDYTAAYLPVRRKAPFQTLVGFYDNRDNLSAYRQFDASGDLLLEECKGIWKGKKFRIVYEDYEVPDDPKTIPDETERAAYSTCFSKLPNHPGKYIDPMAEVAAR